MQQRGLLANTDAGWETVLIRRTVEESLPLLL